MAESTRPGEKPPPQVDLSGNDGGKGITEWSAGKVLRTLRLLNISNAIVLILTAVLVFVIGLVDAGFTEVTIACYIIFFALILLCAEMKFANLQPRIQKQFGFMFTFVGRALFVFFAATLCAAMNKWLTWIVAVGTFLNALFNFYVFYMHPVFTSGTLKKTANPYATYTGAEEEMQNYLSNNPDLARRAVTTTASLAQPSGGNRSGTKKNDENPFTGQ